MRGLASVGAYRETPEQIGDSEIQERIFHLIKQRTSASLQSVTIIVVNGVVYLWGIAETQMDKDAIRVASENVAGADKVHNFLNTLPEVLRGIR